jgi:hypothetical protein
MANDKNTNDSILRLKKYAEGLKMRLRGSVEKELRVVLEIDLKKTEAKITKLSV